ncbi:MAG: gliding motility-associated C-terminal domain-containing protein [Phycisphaerae bacterium]|nr:gliding motility-associated C-terminal domain-containing protein [Saprospiraceae bacterium]
MESMLSVTKTFLFLLFASTLSAQPVFQKKLEGVELAKGLAIMPDGGYTLAGMRGNCIQIVRFDALGTPQWMRQVCQSDPNADLTIGTLQLVSDTQMPGAFLLIFRKGAFSSAPDNLLNIMKFDATGNLLWECQLRPEKRYGPQSPGSQLTLTPSGTAWVAHAMGFTNQFPDFNQVLVSKINPSGQTVLRQFFKTEEPASANGIAAKNDTEIFAYGSLGHAITDGFLLKINEMGNVIWSKRYTGMHFLRDGGFFPNGDLLLMAEFKNHYALARVASDGSMVWASKIPDTLSLFHCSVASNGDVLVAGRNLDGLSMLLKINPVTNLASWAKTYEECTRYSTTALIGSPDGGFVCAQSSSTGLFQTRLFKGDDLGRLSPECPVEEILPPILKTLSVLVLPLPFTFSEAPSQAAEHIFNISDTGIEIKDCCPTEYPEARFVLPDSVCADAPFNLISTGNPCADEWHWQISGAMPEKGQNIEFQNIVCKTTGDYLVSLTETFGVCSDSIHKTLRVVTPLIAAIFLYADTVICPDAPFVLQPHLTGFDSWVWDDGSTATTRILNPPVAGIFRLYAQQGLCLLADSIQIGIGHCGPTRVFIPNAFSPNDDGQSDFWEIFWQSGVQALECKIFDRWGNLCYATEAGETPRWDGLFKGRTMPVGVYVWQFRLRNIEGKEEVFSGDLLLLH